MIHRHPRDPQRSSPSNVEICLFDESASEEATHHDDLRAEYAPRGVADSLDEWSPDSSVGVVDHTGRRLQGVHSDCSRRQWMAEGSSESESNELVKCLRHGRSKEDLLRAGLSRSIRRSPYRRSSFLTCFRRWENPAFTSSENFRGSVSSISPGVSPLQQNNNRIDLRLRKKNRRR